MGTAVATVNPVATAIERITDDHEEPAQAGFFILVHIAFFADLLTASCVPVLVETIHPKMLEPMSEALCQIGGGCWHPGLQVTSDKGLR